MNQMAKALWLGLEKSDMFVNFFATGITGDDWLKKPVGMPNPPIWILGHMAYHRAVFLELVSGKKTYDESWINLFSLGCEPRAAKEYPDADLCFEILKNRLADLKSYLESVSVEDLESPPTKISKFFQTKADVIVHLTHHEAHHTGSLAMARRLLGKDKLI
jgi:uncharacterized damage-inducible protein DinB